MSPIGAAAMQPLGKPGDAPPPPPPPPPPGEGSFVINDAWDPDNPTARNGTPITGTAKSVLDGVRWLVANHNAQRVTGQSGGSSTVNGTADSDNLYHYARVSGPWITELGIALQLTGYARFLDEAVRIGDRMAAVMAVGYRGHDTNVITWSAHPYAMWVDRYADQIGTDLSILNSGRTWLEIARLAHMLDMNRGKTSPAGYNYSSKADFWIGKLEEYVAVWQGPAAWQANYRGNWHNFYRPGSSQYRAPAGYWPILSRHHTHTHVGISAMHVYLGRLKSEWSGAEAVGLHGITELLINRNLVRYTNPYGTAATFARSLQNTGHSGNNYHEPNTYFGYIVKDLVSLWLDGVLPSFGTTFARPIVRTLNERAFTTSGSDVATGDIGGGTTITGITNSSSVLTVTPATSFESPLNPTTFFTRDTSLLLPFDTPDDHMQNHLAARYPSSLDGTNVTDQPRTLAYPLGRLMALIGAGAWSQA